MKTIYVIPDNVNMTANALRELQDALQAQHRMTEKVIVLPPRSHIIIEESGAATVRRVS